MTPPIIEFGRSICNDPAAAGTREWLITNGIGGYGSGTISGELTRRYHGLLIAALQPPLGRMLLAARLDETASYNGRNYDLFTNRWSDGRVEPHGYRYIESFHLDGTTPVWTFAFDDALLERRIWMQDGANTTYAHYRMIRGQLPISLTAAALVNFRDHHGTTFANGWRVRIERAGGGLRVQMGEEAIPLFLLSDRGKWRSVRRWRRDFALSAEQARGYHGIEDHLCAGEMSAVLQPGETLTVIFSTEAAPTRDGEAAYADRQRHEQDILTVVPATSEPRIRQLVLAADQFIVRRATPGDPHGSTVIAGYPWFSDWGRDTMISLPGLSLATGRAEIARSVLRTFAQFVDQGMLPNRFPDEGDSPQYNTVDAALWYLEAVRAYHTATGDNALLRELFPVLEEIIDWHERGTRYRIHVDPEDGLLYAGEEGAQLTWMDVKIREWVVTPRTGKPVDINALWYHGLRTMAEFGRQLGRGELRYSALADRARAGFARFWNQAAGYCYDVLDTPAGPPDPSLRPNQLLAVSLFHSPLSPAQQKAVVDACMLRLLTSYGLRSLAPDHPDYAGHYGGDLAQRDRAYHQGTVWGWLIGPFVSAHLRVYGDPDRARSFIRPLLRHLDEHGLGTISEIFDGDPPFTPNGCIAQAWSVAQVLCTWQVCNTCQDIEAVPDAARHPSGLAGE
jgi:predicted glycogen debranching enzyme